MGATRPKCEVCTEAQSKYKCPSCLIPYCSLACFKKHKEIPCRKLPLPVEISADAAPLSLPKISYEADEQSWILKKEQLQAIVMSNEIRDALKDEDLRNLIRKIDCSKDPVDELDKVMEGQSFCMFTNKILSTICPKE